MEDVSLAGPKPSTDYGFKLPPKLQYINEESVLKHEADNTPKIQSILAAGNPNATGEDRLKAAAALKNATGSEEFRGGDFIQSLIKGNIRDAYIAATGGADIRARAWDQDGNEYVKVFNQRESKANPYGEIRRYETLDGKVLDDASLKGKLITSQFEIPLTQQPFFQAEGIIAKDVAAAQSRNWLNLQDIASKGMLAVPELKSLTTDNRRVLKELQPMSVDPTTRALLAGASEIRTGNTQEFQKASERLKEFAKGNGTSAEFADFAKKNAGLTMGLNYNEGKGFTDSKGRTTTENDLERNINSTKSTMGSSSEVMARKDDLLQRAQALALKGDLKNFNLVQRYINNQFKTANLISEIEKRGGIGVSKPNLEFQTGDSFSLAYTKNELDDVYVDSLDVFAKTVNLARDELKGKIPPLGEVERAVANNPFIKSRKQQAYKDIETFDAENAKTQQAISASKPNPELLAQPGITPPVAAAPPPAAAPVAGTPKKPVGSRPPVAAPAAPAKRSISSILGGK
jgi:hypothetical protein